MSASFGRVFNQQHGEEKSTAIPTAAASNAKKERENISNKKSTQNDDDSNTKIISSRSNNNEKNTSSHLILSSSSPSSFSSPSSTFCLPIRRVKEGKIGKGSSISLDGYGLTISYSPTRTTSQKIFGCSKKKCKKNVHLSGLLEIRQGHRTDNWHRAARTRNFHKIAPEDHCFSIIFKHPRFVCKSIDFLVEDKQKALEWMEKLRALLEQTQHSQGLINSFDEKRWLLLNFQRADLNRNGEIEFAELWRLLKKLNLQLSEQYVRALFQETVARGERGGNSGNGVEALNENEFLDLFAVLTDLPEYRSALRLANPEGNEWLDVESLQKFIAEEQQFEGIDSKKAAAIIDFCEPGGTAPGKPKVLSINGFRRMLQSRWGNILRCGHESVFMNMDQPLHCYFINSSHNTYLTGLQVHGNATIEGYICALRKGSRLLELDLFDGENGEPQITHKRTFIAPISLRNVLNCVRQYAFVQNQFPVILTIENHVSTPQQRIMADIFREILGQHLYIPPSDAHLRPLPSPNALKNKILLRGKTQQSWSCASAKVEAVDDDLTEKEGGEQPGNGEENCCTPPPQSPTIDPNFGSLIALPSVKLTPGNLYMDIKEHPTNGSPSLSERKVQAYLEANAPIALYTSSRVVKSFPSGMRQDSSNIDPMESWICGIQSAAMNFQTCDEDLDVNRGFFSVNGNVGYILKPKVLLEGKDPRHGTEIRSTLEIAIICGQYFPKAEPGNSGIVDPYVRVEIIGVPRDRHKVSTKVVHNNGFNPIWNENLSFPLCCPELAVLRLCVKDFDSTSADEFIGEFSIPVQSIRPGYSHVRLNTGSQHNPDEAASLFIRTAFS